MNNTDGGHGRPRLPRLFTWRRPASWWARALLAVGMLLALMLLLRQPLADRLWPQARIDRLLDEGARALAEGRLDAADGQGARQKYEAAQALDSDRGEARAGLARVGRQALANARQAIGARRFDEAHRWLALAAELQLPRAQVDAVAGQLRQAELADIDPGVVRGRAEAALAAGDVEAALPLFAQWLAVAPDDPAALEGREDALSLLLERVRPALRQGDLVGAARWLALTRRHDPGHVALPDLKAAYAQALAAQLRRVEVQRQRGRLAEAARLVTALHEAEPADAAVAQESQRVALALVVHARRQAGDFHFDAAGEALAQARALAPASGALASALVEAQRDLERARAAEARLHVPERTKDAPASMVRRTLAGFDEALRRGDWIEPPGASAYDRLRAAQGLAPGDPAVRAAATRMQSAVAACVEEGLRDNRLRAAQDCHDAWQALAPSDPALAPARRRLAQRWLAVGEERLRAGELEAAAHALDSARRLDPSTPGLEEFAAQLVRARPGLR
ncbi:hypothetical protein [Pseudoxanthomonas daejeonensis]|uniref:Secreted protein n=1 Tax=Pseudoxanthomonas daejeonensis TaxID=266062 RepID=A0ABQ6Z8B3_9GAMM|nr:hypothetical protein [Pseudoxanthomonas daejeonensis]KAF1695339.1 hypothetical protein CSC65_06100 [Pseudoxanthomonas daejeonensis]